MAAGDLVTTAVQLELRATLFGAGSVYPVAAIEGLDIPDVRSSNMERPTDDGTVPGLDQYAERVVRLRMGIDATVDSALAAKVAALRAAFVKSTVPIPLHFMLRGESKRYLMVLPRRFALVYDQDAALNAPDVLAELVAPDPRILAAIATTLAGAGTATNNGTYKATPVLTVTGAAAGPIVITNTTAGKTVQITTSVPSGQSLVVDFKARSVLLNGVNRYDLVAATPQWFDIAPGNNTITYSGGGTPSLAWNDSWI